MLLKSIGKTEQLDFVPLVLFRSEDGLKILPSSKEQKDQFLKIRRMLI